MDVVTTVALINALLGALAVMASAPGFWGEPLAWGLFWLIMAAVLLLLVVGVVKGLFGRWLVHGAYKVLGLEAES
jgi:hypothetical protein